MNFPICRPGLGISSDPTTFSVSHAFIPHRDKTYNKPVGDRGSFEYRYGDYPITDLRFADGEAVAERIRTSDLEQALGAEIGGLVQISSPRSRECRFSAVQVGTDGRRVESLNLFAPNDRTGEPAKRIVYTYEVGTSNKLQSATIWLKETSLKAHLGGDGAAVTIHGTPLKVREFPLTYEKGGRVCTVKYAPSMSGSPTRFPTSINVSSGFLPNPTNALLRSAQLSNFQSLPPKALRFEADPDHSEFDPKYAEYRAVADRLYRTNAIPNSADLKLADDLYNHFRKPSATESTGERLRRLNVLIDLGPFVSRPGSTRTVFQDYLGTLAAQGLQRMVMVGGCGLAERAARRKRCELAAGFLEETIACLAESTDQAAVLEFAEHETVVGNAWIGLALADAPLSRMVTPQVQFEKTAIISLALNKLANQFAKLASSRAFDGKPALARLIGMDTREISCKLGQNLTQARALSQQLPCTSPLDRRLKSELSRIVAVGVHEGERSGPPILRE